MTTSQQIVAPGKQLKLIVVNRSSATTSKFKPHSSAFISKEINSTKKQRRGLACAPSLANYKGLNPFGAVAIFIYALR
jgi:hypothetical protein